MIYVIENKREYPAPDDIGEIVEARIYLSGSGKELGRSYPSWKLSVLPLGQHMIFSVRDLNQRGMPCMLSLEPNNGKREFVLWPLPDKSYELYVEYNPQRKTV